MVPNLRTLEMSIILSFLRDFNQKYEQLYFITFENRMNFWSWILIKRRLMLFNLFSYFPPFEFHFSLLVSSRKRYVIQKGAHNWINSCFFRLIVKESCFGLVLSMCALHFHFNPIILFLCAVLYTRKEKVTATKVELTIIIAIFNALI